MKPLFAIDLTNDLNNDKMNIESFLARELVKNEQTGATELKTAKKHVIEKKAPEFVTEERELTRRDKRRKQRIEKLMRSVEKERLIEEKKRLEDEQFYDHNTKKRIALMRALESAYSAMEVPSDADDVDVFSFSYVMKAGEMIPVTKYVNLPMKMYVKDRHLYFSDLARAYALSLDSIRSITEVNEKLSFPLWHRDMPHDDSLYTPFNIKYRKLRRMYETKYYYEMKIEEKGEEYSITFAPYDLAAFERLAEVNCTNKKRRKYKWKKVKAK